MLPAVAIAEPDEARADDATAPHEIPLGHAHARLPRAPAQRRGGVERARPHAAGRAPRAQALSAELRAPDPGSVRHEGQDREVVVSVAILRARSAAAPRARSDRLCDAVRDPDAILVGALAVDVGRLAWNRRQLQEVADLAAIDAMRAFGQCRETSGDPVAAAQASAVRNGYDGQPRRVAQRGRDRQRHHAADGVRTFTAGGAAATATAVRVFATREVPFTLIASALACRARPRSRPRRSRRARRSASLSAGSFAARFDHDRFAAAGTSSSARCSAATSRSLRSPTRASPDANFTVGDLVAAASVAIARRAARARADRVRVLAARPTALSDGGDASAAATLSAIAGSGRCGLTVHARRRARHRRGSERRRIRRAAERVRHARVGAPGGAWRRRDRASIRSRVTVPGRRDGHGAAADRRRRRASRSGRPGKRRRRRVEHGRAHGTGAHGDHAGRWATSACSETGR